MECKNELKMMEEQQGRKQGQREKNFQKCLEKRKYQAIDVKVRKFISE